MGKDKIQKQFEKDVRKNKASVSIGLEAIYTAAEKICKSFGEEYITQFLFEQVIQESLLKENEKDPSEIRMYNKDVNAIFTELVRLSKKKMDTTNIPLIDIRTAVSYAKENWNRYHDNLVRIEETEELTASFNDSAGAAKRMAYTKEWENELSKSGIEAAKAGKALRSIMIRFKEIPELEKALKEIKESPVDIMNIHYYPENEGHDEGRTKTFRDLATNKWYYESELVGMFSYEAVQVLKGNVSPEERTGFTISELNTVAEELSNPKTKTMKPEKFVKKFKKRYRDSQFINTLNGRLPFDYTTSMFNLNDETLEFEISRGKTYRIPFDRVILKKPIQTMKGFMGDLPINVIGCYPIYTYISGPGVIEGCLNLSSYDPYWNKREILHKLYGESPLVELIPILSAIKATDTLYAQMKTKLKELKEESSTYKISSNIGLDTIYITPNPKTKEYRATLPKGFIFIDAIGNEDYAHVTYRINDIKKSVKLKKVGKGNISINPETGVIKMS